MSRIAHAGSNLPSDPYWSIRSEANHDAESLGPHETGRHLRVVAAPPKAHSRLLLHNFGLQDHIQTPTRFSTSTLGSFVTRGAVCAAGGGGRCAAAAGGSRHGDDGWSQWLVVVVVMAVVTETARKRGDAGPRSAARHGAGGEGGGHAGGAFQRHAVGRGEDARRWRQEQEVRVGTAAGADRRSGAAEGVAAGGDHAVGGQDGGVAAGG